MWRGVTDIIRLGRRATLDHAEMSWQVMVGSRLYSERRSFLLLRSPEAPKIIRRRAQGRGRVRTRGKPGAMLYLPGTTFGNAQTTGP